MSRTLRSSTACVLVVLLAVAAGAAVLPSRALSMEMVRLPRHGAPAITETVTGVSESSEIVLTPEGHSRHLNRAQVLIGKP